MFLSVMQWVLFAIVLALFARGGYVAAWSLWLNPPHSYEPGMVSIKAGLALTRKRNREMTVLIVLIPVLFLALLYIGIPITD